MRQLHSSIRFKHGAFAELRARLLEDLTQETFAVLFGKRHVLDDEELITVFDVQYPRARDYRGRGLTHIQLDRGYVYDLICEVTQRLDVDTIIDVHTHPFSASGVGFSGVDDNDEITFSDFITETFDDLHYASVVLSQSDYSARVWKNEDGKAEPAYVEVRTQTKEEAWPSAGSKKGLDEWKVEDGNKTTFESRTALTIGLDALRKITDNQCVAVVGVGGLGSQIAENLIHMGFRELVLIDPDVLEISNLNRIVGAYHDDAVAGRPKVDAVREHLLRIQPNADVSSFAVDVKDPSLEKLLAAVDWIVVATDNHSSRFHIQELALRYFVPFISVGVNITVSDGRITDMSGEIITVRAGDCYCLSCLGRINPAKIAAESHPSQHIREQLVVRGYVTGQDVKEPAVKTLNAMLSSLAVDCLINQYTTRQRHIPILVFESNVQPTIFEDRESVEGRNKSCFTCGV